MDDKTAEPCGLAVTDQLLQTLAGLTADGNILPPPAMMAYRISLSSGKRDVAVVEVQPSDIPPVRYKGVVRIRRGPRKGIANESEAPRQKSYRNPVIAEAMKVLGFVNRFGRGVERAQAALADNGSLPAEFEFGDTYFGVTVRARP